MDWTRQYLFYSEEVQSNFVKVINYISGTIRTQNNSLLTALATRNAEFLPLQRQAWGKGDFVAQDPKPRILEYHTWHTFHFYIKCLRVQRVIHFAFPTICRMGTHQSISNCKWITLQNRYTTVRTTTFTLKMLSEKVLKCHVLSILEISNPSIPSILSLYLFIVWISSYSLYENFLFILITRLSPRA